MDYQVEHDIPPIVINTLLSFVGIIGNGVIVAVTIKKR